MESRWETVGDGGKPPSSQEVANSVSHKFGEGIWKRVLTVLVEAQASLTKTTTAESERERQRFNRDVTAGETAISEIPGGAPRSVWKR
jgi:hypothetical protein